MLIKSTSLQKSLKLFPVYAVFGDELLIVQESLSFIRNFLTNAGFTHRKIFYVEHHFDWSTISTMQTGGLFDDGQLFEIHFNGQPNKEAILRIKTILTKCTTATFHVYLFVLPVLDSAAIRSSWFELLEKNGLVVQVEKINRNQLGAWIRGRLSAQKQFIGNNEAGSRALSFVVDHVEGNLLGAYQEILKLGLIYPIGELTEEQIITAVTNVARFDVFKFRNALFENNLIRLTNIFYSLREEGESPSLVLWALVEELRCLDRVISFIQKGNSFDAAAKRYRLWGPRSHIYKLIVKRISLQQINRGISFASLIDCQIKGVLNLSEKKFFMSPIAFGSDPWDSLYNLTRYLSDF